MKRENRMKREHRELLQQLGLRPGPELLYLAVLELGRRCLELERRVAELENRGVSRTVRRALARLAG